MVLEPTRTRGNKLCQTSNRSRESRGASETLTGMEEGNAKTRTTSPLQALGCMPECSTQRRRKETTDIEAIRQTIHHLAFLPSFRRVVMSASNLKWAIEAFAYGGFYERSQ